MTHPDFDQVQDCNPNPNDEIMSDEDYFELYGKDEDDLSGQLPFEDEEAHWLDELYNRG